MKNKENRLKYLLNALITFNSSVIIQGLNRRFKVARPKYCRESVHMMGHIKNLKKQILQWVTNPVTNF